MRRVAITGLGVLAPNGVGAKNFAEGLWEGRSGVDRIRPFDPSGFNSQIAGQLPAVELPGSEATEPDGDDRVVRIALAAAREAMAHAGLAGGEGLDPYRSGAVIANAIGGTRFMTEHFPDITKNGTEPIDVAAAHPRLHLSATFNTPTAAVADSYGLRGPSVTVTTGCTGGNDAVGFAFDAIRRGEADVMVAGAAEAPVTPFVVACFDVIGALSVRNADPEHASRPFDRERDGFVLAEGAGIAVLEEWEHAKARGATILGEVLGFGSTANAFHMTDLAEHGTDLARSFQLALDDARLAGERIGYVNAHGSSTPQNDVCETNAVKRVLGAHAYDVPVSSIKSMVGHALAAANALEFVASVLVLKDRMLPPTINHSASGEHCDLDYVPNTAREATVDAIASLSSGFGGIHSTVVLGRA
ncbi:beta-ketoacyl-[acyl-carrier-protein] synthase family protein [Streptomyces sp. LHD-70]|uniref:beta-ketoacyl-[acyl-carrier-protein] synthase family protein n=1 Tax=Streptomyces sp. LHD-70 TaxID=3072140 RepID=UPI00280E01AC|nr:beta-ketoacyl-[acyl-carrier-protein] synthase family protein [Streptomyces sp. LHD-70]MDQ8705981.1 beta-ketoacyl-[acyl-carrier-protein] synthase family protein [Streptomyces sp. LHD-70]